MEISEVNCFYSFLLIVPIFGYWLGYLTIFMPDKRRTLVFTKTLIVSAASSFLFIVLSITLAPIIVEFGLDVIDVIVNLGKWNHAELAMELHISHQRVRTLKKKESMVTGHGNCGKMEAEAYSVPGAHKLRFPQ